MPRKTLPMAEPPVAEPAFGCLLKIPQVAERLQVSERTVHRLIASGELAATRIGRSVRISEQALKALLTGLPADVGGCQNSCGFNGS